MTCAELYAVLNEKIPASLSCSWDNDGLMCCSEPERAVRRVLVALDITGGVIDEAIAREGLRLLEIDELGLDNTDRRMLEAIIKYYGGGPVGLDTLAATIGEEAITIEDVYEPYLLQIGFLSRTPRGRCATAGAYNHLGLPFPAAAGNPTRANQPSLFDSDED